MLEIKGDIWDYYDLGFPITITTNGDINSSGKNVMGKGIALEAKKRFPKLPKFIAEHLKDVGNIVKYYPVYNLFSFPTKHHWWEISDINLIKWSCEGLNIIVSDPLKTFTKVYMTRPGCGNGALDWKKVKSEIENILDNRFIIVNK